MSADALHRRRRSRALLPGAGRLDAEGARGDVVPDLARGARFSARTVRVRLLNLLASIDTEASGSLRGGDTRIDGRAIGPEHAPPPIGFVFQESRLLDWRTLRRNIELPLEETALSKEERYARAAHYIRLSGLTGLRGLLPESNLRWDAAARGSRSGTGRRSHNPPHGRALQRARRADGAADARGAHPDLAGDREDYPLRNPRHLPRRPSCPNACCS